MPLINTRIMGHPLNWAIVILMLVIAGMGGHLLLSLLDQEPTRAGDAKTPAGLSTEQLATNDANFAYMSSLASSN